MMTIDEVQRRVGAAQVAVAQAERAAMGARINCDRITAEASQHLMPTDNDDEPQIEDMFKSLAVANQLVADAYKNVADLYTQAQKMGADMDGFLKELDA